MNRASDVAVNDYIATAMPEELKDLKLMIIARERELDQRSKKLQNSRLRMVEESTKSHMS
jgi:hypothetical protein